jgi:hypothetical protein
MHYQQGFHGKGCKEMTKPSALAKSKAWYIVVLDDNDVVYRWTTREYELKGNKLVVDGRERTGTGRFPPSKACP